MVHDHLDSVAYEQAVGRLRRIGASAARMQVAPGEPWERDIPCGSAACEGTGKLETTMQKAAYDDDHPHEGHGDDEHGVHSGVQLRLSCRQCFAGTGMVVGADEVGEGY